MDCREHRKIDCHVIHERLAQRNAKRAEMLKEFELCHFEEHQVDAQDQVKQTVGSGAVLARASEVTGRLAIFTLDAFLALLLVIPFRYPPARSDAGSRPHFTNIIELRRGHLFVHGGSKSQRTLIYVIVPMISP